MKTHYWAMNMPWNSTDCTAEEDLGHLYFNGAVFPVYSLPAVKCPCKHHTANCSAPFECPQKFREHPRILEGWPVEIAVFKQLRDEVILELKNQGIVYNERIMDSWDWMVPGMDFQPFEFKIAMRPLFSFHWAYWNSRHAVVKPEVKECFEKHGVTGVSFHQVNITLVGKGPTDHYPQYMEIPGWFEDPPFIPPKSITKAEAEENPQSFGPLYLMRVDHSGPDWHNYNDRCPECGIYYDIKSKSEGRTIRHANLLPQYDMFFTCITDEVIITDQMYQLMHDYKFTNLPVFRKLEFL